MFSLCADGAHAQTSTTIEEPVFEREGNSDDTPIHLQGDSVDEFRDLLWSLYALPHEISIMTSPPLAHSNVVKLANIARITHKYHFANIEEWALSALRSLQMEGSTPIETHLLIRVTEVAVLCDDAKLLQLVREKWKGLIGENKDLAVAIDVFERLGIHDLRGRAYYAMMLQGRQKWNSDPLLTREHRIRLLSGYHTISEICANLPSNPPTFFHHDYCGHVDWCQKSWETLWNDMTTSRFEGGIPDDEQVVALDMNDLICNMMTLIKLCKARLEDNRPRDWTQINDDCFPLAFEAMIVVAKDVEAQAIDAFQDVK